MSLFKKAGIGYTLGGATPLMKAFAEPGLPDGGRRYDAITCVDETIRKGDPGHEFIVWVNKTDLRIALLEAIQRGDPRVRYNDASLIDSNRLRRSVGEALYPSYPWSRTEEGGEVPATGGETFRKSKGGTEEVLRDAYGNYVKSSPGVNLRAAAAELDALVERVKNG